MENKAQQLIDSLYKILPLYEEAKRNSFVSKENYLKYLDKLYIRFTGYGDINILISIKGLQKSGLDVSHKTVKSITFDMIDIVKKREGGVA